MTHDKRLTTTTAFHERSRPRERHCSAYAREIASGILTSTLASHADAW